MSASSTRCWPSPRCCIRGALPAIASWSWISTRAASPPTAPWPWPRSRVADLVEAVDNAGAAAVAIDILFEGPDAKTPAALARRLGREAGRADITAWADALPDGDRRLAKMLARVPVALGFALDPVGTATVPSVPFLTRGAVVLPRLWRAPGAIAPLADLVDHASGLGGLALPGDGDGMVRPVPLLVGVGDRVRPGLAAEAVRLAQEASAYRLDGTGATLGIGDLIVRLPPDAMLRLIPGTAGAVAARISAFRLLTQRELAPRLHQAIVLIGSSAPELGGLRSTPGDPLMPTVMLHAAAIDQLLRGRVPLSVPHEDALSAPLDLLAAVAGLLAALLLRPAPSALTAACLVALIAAAAVVAAIGDWMFAPLLPIILLATAFTSAALVRAAQTQLRETRLRQRFAQHLAPTVVELIAASPEALVTLLDEYFEGVAQIVIDHGGIVDKLVGDAVHALFNTPIDLADHPVKAVHCAIAIRAWTEAYRQTPRAVELGLGRTRIGLETGDAVVGDVGIRAKLDFTAYGDAVNSAARLEVANKELGSAICVGPTTALCCPLGLLRPTGIITLRGFTEAVPTSEPQCTTTDPTVAALSSPRVSASSDGG
jgi:adenylate cyclase